MSQVTDEIIFNATGAKMSSKENYFLMKVQFKSESISYFR